MLIFLSTDWGKVHFASDNPNSLKVYLLRMTYILYSDYIATILPQNAPPISEIEQDHVASYFTQSTVCQVLRNLNQTEDLITPESILHNGVEVGRISLKLYLEDLMKKPGKLRPLLVKEPGVLS
jgi:hypothetical protein